MMELFLHPHTNEKYHQNPLKVEVSESLHGSHTITFRSGDDLTHLFCSLEQLAGIAKGITMYLSNRADFVAVE